MLVPGAPAYSPAHAAMATELGSFEVFERERRDEAFAGRREQFLREHATVVFERHGPEVRLASLECRSGACLVTLDAPDTPWSRTLAGAISWGRLQDMRVHEPVDGRILIEIATLMDRELLHHATYERYLTDWRRTMAADLDHLRASMHDAQAGE